MFTRALLVVSPLMFLAACSTEPTEVEATSNAVSVTVEADCTDEAVLNITFGHEDLILLNIETDHYSTEHFGPWERTYKRTNATAELIAHIEPRAGECTTRLTDADTGELISEHTGGGEFTHYAYLTA